MKEMIQAFDRHYFRFMTLLMRAFVITNLAMIFIATLSRLMSGDPFTTNWAVFYAVALPVLGAIWLASNKVRQMGQRSK